MVYQKKFKVVAIDSYGTEEVVAVCKTRQDKRNSRL